MSPPIRRRSTISSASLSRSRTPRRRLEHRQRLATHDMGCLVDHKLVDQTPGQQVPETGLGPASTRSVIDLRAARSASTAATSILAPSAATLTTSAPASSPRLESFVAVDGWSIPAWSAYSPTAACADAYRAPHAAVACPPVSIDRRAPSMRGRRRGRCRCRSVSRRIARAGAAHRHGPRAR